MNSHNDAGDGVWTGYTRSTLHLLTVLRLMRVLHRVQTDRKNDVDER
jgi:hypothetical protein